MEAVEKPKIKQVKKKKENWIVASTSSNPAQNESSTKPNLLYSKTVPEHNEIKNHIIEPSDENVHKIEEKQDESNITSYISAPVEDTPDKLLSANRDLANMLKFEQINEDLITKSLLPKETNKDSKLHQLLLSNQEIANSLKLQQINEDLLAKSKKKELMTIRAYSESQLAALYTNNELQVIEQFSSQFVEAELKGLASKGHPLYELLENYLQVRLKITNNSIEVEQLRKEYKESQLQLWTLESAVVSGRGECHDGTTVMTTHNYNKATFHRTVFQTIGRILASVRKLVTKTHILYAYSAEDLNLQIELYLQTLILNCSKVAQLSQTAPVSLAVQSVPPHLIPFLNELRLCISVLFLFQRRLIRDVQFIKETRDWLKRLVAVLLRLSSWQDHLFLLNHVLRCPPGVGSWGSSFIQTPLNCNTEESPFANHQINHVIATLSLILTPVEKREQFLEQFAQLRETPGEALWVIVDSDGEEDEESSGTGLKENDLVLLLNQLPFDDVFRAILLIEHKNEQDFYDSSKISEHHVLRFFALSTILLRILRKGLQTYDQPRYNQFSKRLCRFIRHIVQYATDQWESFQQNQKLDDTAMLERLQVEYDAFFLRATHYLYTSQRMGAWQFLAVVPYNMVSIKTLWRIFYLLHNNDTSVELILNPAETTNYEEKLWDLQLRSQFEDKLGIMDDAEMYYLLNTFANMALARNEEDMEFIRVATMDLLQVGFVSEATQEKCSKNARILLAHITSKYPQLLSYILSCVKENIQQIGSLCLYLYEDLPLSIWKPTEEDIDIMSRWILNNSISTDESRLSRMILSRLNWDLTASGSLFLPYLMHCKVALLVARVTDQEPGYLPWAWQTIFRLRLHINDKGFNDFTKIPDIEQFDAINKGVREQQPLPCFIAVLMTSWGHLIPLVCSKGLPLLQVLQLHQKHDAVLFALNLIVPLFINCQESLINSEIFQNVLTGLLNADRGYINMAKSLVVAQHTILEQFGNMIESQLTNYVWYSLNSPRYIVRLWMNSLVSIPNWNKDFGVMYLLNIIIKIAFFYSDAMEAAAAILKDLLQCLSPQEQGSSISSLFKWVSQTQAPPGSLIANSSLSSYTWLAYVLIELEYEEREKQTGLWKETLTQLRNQKGKVNVDACIKKAASIVRVSSFTSGSLCIYRWAQQALDTPIDHPLLLLLWQKFFSLYLIRVPTAERCDKGCVGDKFFDGIINLTYLKRLKKHLQETVDFYEKNVEDEKLNINRKQFYENCHRVFRAYSLWLEEPRLQEAGLMLASLPPQYESALLALILQENTTPWTDYIDYENIQINQQKSIKAWKISIYRERNAVNLPLPNVSKQLEGDDPIERIKKRLASYDKPKAPPILKNVAPVIPPLNFNDKDVMFNALKPSFKILAQFAHDHLLKVSEYKALDSSYKELAPQLYRSVLHKIKKQIPCRGANQTVNCAGPAVITLEMQEGRINERVDHQIQTNRSDYESLVSKTLQVPAQTLCVASVTIQHVINVLRAKVQTNPEVAEMGVELFYHLLSMINDETDSFPPTKQLFTICIEKLGQAHISGFEFEMPRLLDRILKEPALGGLLAPHFTPANIGTANFLLMYSTIINDISQRPDVAFALLSKFDIANWLTIKQPKLSQRSKFIESVVKALVTLGFEPPSEALMLHEVFRKHLLCVFEFQFPEHYGEVLMALLKVSNGGNDTGHIAVTVWLDILDSLAKPVKIKLNLPIREQLRQCAQLQQVLRYQELLETASLLARYFSNERLQYGLYGLYPKYRKYLDIFLVLFGITGHGLIISALNTHQGLLGNKLCEIIWPHIRDMFCPWIVPYWMHNFKDHMAAWIQQLTDDRAALLPWISADGPFAQKAVHMFFECILFITQMLPACNVILSYVWHWYVTNFAHPSVKDHILNVIHVSLLALPWNNFWPSIADLEMMLKVIEQYLPECHVFLGQIFIEIPWTNWLSCLGDGTPLQILFRVHQCLLHLLVKISNEPNIRNNHKEKIKALLVQAESFNWIILDANVYQQVIDWYVMSCDPLVVFANDALDLDFRVLRLLQTVASYDKPLENPTSDLLQKRRIYIRGYVKLLSVLSSRHKSLVPTRENQLNAAITLQLTHMEKVIKTEDEFVIILEEFLGILNIQAISGSCVKCMDRLLASKSGDSLMIRIILKILAVSVNDVEAVAILCETTLHCYFENSRDLKPSWNDVANLIKTSSRQTQLEDALIARGKLLTLYALLLQRSSKCAEILRLLNIILDWLNHIKISPGIETKLPLIWSEFLSLCLKYVKIDEPRTGAILHRFSQILLQIAVEKGASSWGKGILGAIGIVKQDAVSIKFKFLCRALAGFILAQLPDMKGDPQVVRCCAYASAVVGQPGGNTECVKVLLGLDFGQSQGEIKNCAELALKQIQDPNNSLHSSKKFLSLLLMQLYMKPYLKNIDEL